jgi:hypothetical protein
MILFKVLVVIFFLVPVFSLAENECGGLSSLSSKVGALCDASGTSPCQFGITACYGKNAIMCSPDCGITAKQVLGLLKAVSLSSSTQDTNTCMNGGKMDPVTSKCTCPHYYIGEHCETRDMCADVECGLNGYCVNGICVCDSLFTGNKCEIKSGCHPPNFVWTGTACRCQTGYEGDECDRCITGLLCFPDDIAGDAYSPVLFDPKEPSIINELLSAPPPPPYTAKPYVPTVAQSCACVTLQEGSSGMVSFFNDPDSSWYHGDYVHRYFKHHYSRSDGCYPIESVATSIFVTVVIILLIFLLVRCYAREPRLLKESLPSRSPTARSPPNRKNQGYLEMKPK